MGEIFAHDRAVPRETRDPSFDVTSLGHSPPPPKAASLGRGFFSLAAPLLYSSSPPPPDVMVVEFRPARRFPMQGKHLNLSQVVLGTLYPYPFSDPRTYSPPKEGKRDAGSPTVPLASAVRTLWSSSEQLAAWLPRFPHLTSCFSPRAEKQQPPVPAPSSAAFSRRGGGGQ